MRAKNTALTKQNIKWNMTANAKRMRGFHRERVAEVGVNHWAGFLALTFLVLQGPRP